MPFSSKVLRDLVVISDQLQDPDLLIDVITIFTEQAPLQIHELSEALLQKKSALVKFQVHKLKTSADVVGSKSLKELCLQIESLLPDLVEELAPILESLEAEVKSECLRIKTELANYLRSTRPR